MGPPAGGGPIDIGAAGAEVDHLADGDSRAVVGGAIDRVQVGPVGEGAGRRRLRRRGGVEGRCRPGICGGGRGAGVGGRGRHGSGIGGRGRQRTGVRRQRDRRTVALPEDNPATGVLEFLHSSVGGVRGGSEDRPRPEAIARATARFP